MSHTYIQIARANYAVKTAADVEKVSSMPRGAAQVLLLSRAWARKRERGGIEGYVLQCKRKKTKINTMSCLTPIACHEVMLPPRRRRRLILFHRRSQYL
jgi:hypothetical protein